MPMAMATLAILAVVGIGIEEVDTPEEDMVLDQVKKKRKKKRKITDPEVNEEGDTGGTGDMGDMGDMGEEVDMQEVTPK